MSELLFDMLVALWLLFAVSIVFLVLAFQLFGLTTSELSPNDAPQLIRDIRNNNKVESNSVKELAAPNRFVPEQHCKGKHYYFPSKRYHLNIGSNEKEPIVYSCCAYLADNSATVSATCLRTPIGETTSRLAPREIILPTNSTVGST